METRNIVGSETSPKQNRVVLLSRSNFELRHPSGSRLDNGEGSTGVKVFEDTLNPSKVAKHGLEPVRNEGVAISILKNEPVEMFFDGTASAISVDKATGKTVPEALADAAGYPDQTLSVLKSAIAETLTKMKIGYESGVRLVDVNWSQMRINEGTSKWVDFGGSEIGMENIIGAEKTMKFFENLKSLGDLSISIARPEIYQSKLRQLHDYVEKVSSSQTKINLREAEDLVLGLIAMAKDKKITIHLNDDDQSEMLSKVAEIDRWVAGQKNQINAREMLSLAGGLSNLLDTAVDKIILGKEILKDPEGFVEEMSKTIIADFGFFDELPVKNYRSRPDSTIKSKLREMAYSVGKPDFSANVGQLVSTIKSEIATSLEIRTVGLKDDLDRLGILVLGELDGIASAGKIYLGARNLARGDFEFVQGEFNEIIEKIKALKTQTNRTDYYSELDELQKKLGSRLGQLSRKLDKNLDLDHLKSFV